MKAGDPLEVMGPLGNGFDLETGKEKKALLFGGGIGVPPMLGARAACPSACSSSGRSSARQNCWALRKLTRLPGAVLR